MPDSEEVANELARIVYRLSLKHAAAGDDAEAVAREWLKQHKTNRITKKPDSSDVTSLAALIENIAAGRVAKTREIAVKLEGFFKQEKVRAEKAERERDEAERLLRLACAKVCGHEEDHRGNLELLRKGQSPELADISIAIEVAFQERQAENITEISDRMQNLTQELLKASGLGEGSRPESCLVLLETVILEQVKQLAQQAAWPQLVSSVVCRHENAKRLIVCDECGSALGDDDLCTMYANQ